MLLIGDDLLGRRRLRQQPVDALAFVLEGGQQAAVQLAGARQLDLHRIDEMAVDQDFVVKMRAGREPGLAEVADHLALANPCALDRAAGEARHVIIGGDVAVGVLDLDAPAIARIPARLDDHAIARGENRRADRGPPVDPGVRPRIAENGMEP